MGSDPSRAGADRPASRCIAEPIEEHSSASCTQPLCQGADAAVPYNRGLSSDIQMHFLDNMHHATHWLQQHEMQRSKKPLGSRLCSIKSGHCLPLLEKMSSTRRAPPRAKMIVQEDDSGILPLSSECENIPEQGIEVGISIDENCEEYENIPEQDIEVGISVDQNCEQHNLRAFQLELFWKELDSVTEPVTPDCYLFASMPSA